MNLWSLPHGHRRGVEVSYDTLRHFAPWQLGFGRSAPTVAVADCEPGQALEFDTGWMARHEPELAVK